MNVGGADGVPLAARGGDRETAQQDLEEDFRTLDYRLALQSHRLSSACCRATTIPGHPLRTSAMGPIADQKSVGDVTAAFVPIVLQKSGNAG
jgi:hypothetical protein